MWSRRSRTSSQAYVIHEKYYEQTECDCVVCRTRSETHIRFHSCSMQHADCMDLPLHRRADSTFRISLKMQNADAECRMQNPAQNDYSVCAGCRMQDAGSPQMDSSAWCRMLQNAGCKIRPKEFVRWVQLTALSPILHPASASCILHRVQGIWLWARFCILHSASAPAWGSAAGHICFDSAGPIAVMGRLLASLGAPTRRA